MTRPIIGITMGDASGVGPEIIIKALAKEEIYRQCRPIVIGDAKILERARNIVGASLAVRPIEEIETAIFQWGTVDCLDLDLLPADLPFGQVSAQAGDAAFRFL